MDQLLSLVLLILKYIQDFYLSTIHMGDFQSNTKYSLEVPYLSVP